MPKSRLRKHAKRSRRAQSQGRLDEGIGIPGYKLSRLILDLIKPYRESAPSHDELDRLVLAGITAWNLSLLPEDQRQGQLDSLVRRILSGERRSLRGRVLYALLRLIGRQDESRKREDDAAAGEFKQLIRELVDRKMAMFPQYRHIIADYKLDTSEDEIRLYVVYALDKI